MKFSLKISCYKFCFTYLFQVGNKRRRTKNLSFHFQFFKMYASVLLRDTILDVLLGDSSKTKLCHSPQTLSQPSTRQGYSSSSLLRRSSRLMAAFMATSPCSVQTECAVLHRRRYPKIGKHLSHTWQAAGAAAASSANSHAFNTCAVPWGTRAQDAEG